MNPRNTRALVFATALLTVPLLPAWVQAQGTPAQDPAMAPQDPAMAPQDPAMAPQDPANPAVPPQDPNAPQQPAAPAAPQDPSAAQGQPQGTAPAAPGAGPKVMTPEQIGISFAAPPGWQQGDPTKFTLPGDICCAWSPDNVASIVAFVQKTGKPLNPKVLLEQSAQALQTGVGAQVKTKEVIDIGGKRGFSLVVTAPGSGAAIDGKGAVLTTQHWVAIPREQDVIIFLMTTPDEKFAANEQVFQSLLSSLQVSGTQTPDQVQASR